MAFGWNGPAVTPLASVGMASQLRHLIRLEWPHSYATWNAFGWNGLANSVYTSNELVPRIKMEKFGFNFWRVKKNTSEKLHLECNLKIM